VNFCSRQAIVSGASLAGTGVRAAAYALLPVPKRYWHVDELNAGWATPEELAAVKHARSEGVLTRLYNPATNDAPALVFQGPVAAAALTGLLDALAGRFAVDMAPAPAFAVCTQGTRDRCCAKWGFAVFREAMKLRAEDRFPFQPLECSHLGGDRFAATGVFFPSGGMYAHLDTADLARVAAAEAAGRIGPAPYRGRVFESELLQVVRAGLHRDGVADAATTPITALEPEAHAPGLVHVVLHDGRGFTVRLGWEETRFHSSCSALDRGRVSRGRRMVYAGAEPSR
jgi:hypothetical protein